MTEEPLGGGTNAREVVRVGNTVHRARDAGSGFAAQVLAYLESAGYPYAPRYLGVDDGGRDILSYIPGQTTDHPSQRADGAYTRGGAMLRLLHETTAGHRLAAGRDCVLHGDPGPFNTIFWQGLPVAFIDWSSCRPGDRRDDLGYLAWTWCIQSQGHVPIAEQARHLRELRDGYGDSEPENLLNAMMRSQTRIVDLETANLSNPGSRLPAASTQRQPSRGPAPTVRSSASTKHCCCPRCAGPRHIYSATHLSDAELINSGVSIEVVRRRLGHASTETTQVYTLLADKVADTEIRAARRKREAGR